MSNPDRLHRLVNIVIFLAFIAGVVYLCLLSTRPLVAQGVYIDENALLPGQARTTANDPQLINQIHDLTQLCYLPSTEFGECLCAIGRSFGFSCIYGDHHYEHSIVQLQYNSPRVSGADGIVLAASVFPIEFSSSISSFEVLLAAIISAARAGFLSRNVILYVPLPHQLYVFDALSSSLFSPSSSEDGYQQRVTAIPMGSPLLYTPMYSWTTYSHLLELQQQQQKRYSSHLSHGGDVHGVYPSLHMYDTWKTAYLARFNTILAIYPPLTTPSAALAVEFPPLSCFNAVSVQSIYPYGHQGNLDIASSLIHALRNSNVLIHEPSMPSHPDYPSLLSGRGSPQQQQAVVEYPPQTEPWLYSVYRRHIRPIWHQLWAVFDRVRITPESLGMSRYMFAQFSAGHHQYLHSALSYGGLDAIGLTGVVTDLSLDDYDKQLARIIQSYSPYQTAIAAVDTKQHPHGTEFTEAIKLLPSEHYGTTTCPNGKDLRKYVQSIELWLRMMSNTHEKLHHSTWLYILASTQNFTTMSNYVPAFILLWVSIPLLGLFAIFFVKKTSDDDSTSSQDNPQQEVNQNKATSSTTSSSITDGLPPAPSPPLQSPHPRLSSQQQQQQQLTTTIYTDISHGFFILLLFAILSQYPRLHAYCIHQYFYPLLSTLLETTTTSHILLPLLSRWSLMEIFTCIDLVMYTSGILVVLRVTYHHASNIHSLAWLVVLSPLVAPLAVMNYTFGLLLCLFIVPLVYIIRPFPQDVQSSSSAQNDFSTSQKTQSKTRPLQVRILPRLVLYIMICILLSPMTWVLVYRLYATSWPFDPTTQCIYNTYTGSWNYPLHTLGCFIQRWRGINLEWVQYSPQLTKVSTIITQGVSVLDMTYLTHLLSAVWDMIYTTNPLPLLQTSSISSSSSSSSSGIDGIGNITSLFHYDQLNISAVSQSSMNSSLFPSYINQFINVLSPAVFSIQQIAFFVIYLSVYWYAVSITIHGLLSLVKPRGRNGIHPEAR